MEDGISLEADYQELQQNYKQVQTEAHDLKKQLYLSLQTVRHNNNNNNNNFIETRLQGTIGK